MEVKRKMMKHGAGMIMKIGATIINNTKRQCLFVKLPSFNGDSDPNVYLGCKANF